MKKYFGLLVGLAVGVVCIALLFQAGCETTSDTVALTIEPNYVDLTVSTNGTSTTATQTFTATNGLRDLSLPLKWSVSDSSLGSIGSSGGTTASYVRTTKTGDNSIEVIDQYGASGVATVHQ